jgi:hypothetical protein
VRVIITRDYTCCYTIAENMWAQCNIDGNQWLLNGTVPKDKAFISVNNRKHRVKTTKGRELCIQWKDGTATWQRLADMKESNPVEVAEYAVARGIDDKPVFACWVEWTLKRKDRIVAAVNNRSLKRTHKFGIAIPRNVEEAGRLDKQNGNTLWATAIDKEMRNIRVAFKILLDGQDAPVLHINSSGAMEYLMSRWIPFKGSIAWLQVVI